MKNASFIRIAVTFAALASSLLSAQSPAPSGLKLNDLEYLEMPGLNVMAFQDIYPEGHQGGISIVQNGVRVATNGDLRLEVAPGQWSAVAKQEKRAIQRETNEIATWLSYTARAGMDSEPIPNLSYQVRVLSEGQGFRIIVNLDRPLPANLTGKLGLNLEFYPGALFGKTWHLGGESGIFPRQPDGPNEVVNGAVSPVPLAVGQRLSIAPEVEAQRLVIESRTGNLQLLDPRSKQNNAWFIVRSVVPAGASSRAIEWVVTPHAIPGWKYEPVVHVSQVGYHPKQKKTAVVETDASASTEAMLLIKRIDEDGGMKTVLSGKPQEWGRYLRYKYLQLDFSQITTPGMYLVEYGRFRTEPFRIAADVYQRGVWQPVLEYFLPVQMCHMRVEQQERVWHGACHLDDARMAQTNHIHFDGYKQGPSTLTSFKPGETVPGLNVGGWHDAGDDDLRIESQADEVRILAYAYELFNLNYDDTTIDEANRVAQIHRPDGKPDVLQQVEHGVQTLLGSYESMGRFYRGIISSSLPQYVLMGDTVNATDNLLYKSSLSNKRDAVYSGKPDDRWVFTEQNAGHEYKGIAALAAAGRVLKGFAPSMANKCIQTAESAWMQEPATQDGFDDKIVAAVELWLTTGKPEYGEVLSRNRERILTRIGSVGWAVGRVLDRIPDKTFVDQVRSAVKHNHSKVTQNDSATPFGVPYRPKIWGAGWDIQHFGVQQYFLHRYFPDIVEADYMLNALNFVLGVHPGENTASFASGVGARSATVAYGYNRADWSYIPGGVVSGTALIRPDLPELKDFPFLWQQTEYVMGGGSSNYMFLVLAADQVLNAE
jgi:hypothetical protein